MVDFLPCLREGEIDPYVCIRSRFPQDFIPPNVIGRSDTDGESNRRGGIDRKSLVSMLARLAQRTASVWDGSVEYEYRDAEYEYRDAEYEYDEITEWMSWDLRASARALESDMVRKTRDCRQ